MCILAGAAALIWAWLPSAGWLYAVALLAVGVCLASGAWAGESMPSSARRALVISGLTLSVMAIIGSAAAALPALAVVPFIAAVGGYVELWRRDAHRRAPQRPQGMADGVRAD